MTDAELRRLARDRELLTTELHPFNAFYGHAELIRRYTGWTRRGPLKATLEHGVVFIHSIVPELELGIELPLFLCHSEARAEAYLGRDPAARAEPIGVPILYADALQASPPRDGKSRLVIFPGHSSRYVRSRYEVDGLLDTLRSWAREFDVVVVCLYWLDVVRGAQEAYARQGFRCVTAGHMFDRRFVVRLLEILRTADAVATNDRGSHVIYAGLLGKPVWIIPAELEIEHEHDVPASARALVDRALGGDLSLYETVAEIFADPRPELSTEQRDLVDEVGGKRHFRAPTELRALLTWAEDAYRELPPGRRLGYTARAGARLARNAVRQTRLAVAR